MSGHDPLRGRLVGHNYSAARQLAITPNDDADLEVIPRAVYVAESGMVNMVLMGDSEPGAIYLAAGVAHPLRPKRILATDTTATGIVGVY